MILANLRKKIYHCTVVNVQRKIIFCLFYEKKILVLFVCGTLQGTCGKQKPTTVTNELEYCIPRLNPVRIDQPHNLITCA